MNDPAAPRRRVRSFVRRAGRITGAQQRALVELWPRFGVEFAAQPIDLDALFGRRAPRVLEIGFGNGEALVALAAASPERDFLGIEVHEPGVGHALLRAQALDLTNLRISRHDAVEVLEEQITDASIAETLIFFPDPWPKARHHKRRLVSAATLGELARIMCVGAELRIATDDADYARWILLAVVGQRNFAWTAEGPADWRQRPPDWPPTRYEQKAKKAGRRCYYFRFRRR
jgi:tRNA (guanine-N7-)-methyltransferase